MSSTDSSTPEWRCADGVHEISKGRVGEDLDMTSVREVSRRVRSLAANTVRVLRANPLTLIGFILVLLISATAVLVVVVPPVTGAILGHPVSLTPYDPNVLLPCPVAGNRSFCAQPPSAEHLFGTDDSGRDVFSRVLVALPLDLLIGFSVAGVSLLFCGGVGFICGFLGKPWAIRGGVSLTIMRLTPRFLAFPSL